MPSKGSNSLFPSKYCRQQPFCPGKVANAEEDWFGNGDNILCLREKIATISTPTNRKRYDATLNIVTCNSDNGYDTPTLS
jgi:hypothetical protein